MQNIPDLSERTCQAPRTFKRVDAKVMFVLISVLSPSPWIGQQSEIKDHRSVHRCWYCRNHTGWSTAGVKMCYSLPTILRQRGGNDGVSKCVPSSHEPRGAGTSSGLWFIFARGLRPYAKLNARTPFTADSKFQAFKTFKLSTFLRFLGRQLL